jgi:hypothetical protein
MVKGSSMCSHLHSSSLEPKKLLVLSVNGMLCYFPPFVVLQRNVKAFGKKVERTKVEVKDGMEFFFQQSILKVSYCNLVLYET